MKSKSCWLEAMLVAVGLSAMLAVIGPASAAEAQERKVPVLPSELPAVIRQAVREACPKGRIMRVQKEVEGEDPGQYDVDVRSDEKEYEIELSPEGKVLEIKERTLAERAPGSKESKKWTKSFQHENCTFSTVGRNRFFILEPGHQLVLEGPQERVGITVLDETRDIGGVQTRVVEEREEENGELKEVSRNFFAICREHGDVFYFGEEVDIYKDGKIVEHSGAWRADEANCRAGIIMPGTILLGARHYQEIAPNAMDRAEIISDDVTMKTPAGTFEHCIRVEETSGIDPDEKYYKTYAPGVGLIQDEDLLLTGYRGTRRTSVSFEDLRPGAGPSRRTQAAKRTIEEIETEIIVENEREHERDEGRGDNRKILIEAFLAEVTLSWLHESGAGLSGGELESVSAMKILRCLEDGKSGKIIGGAKVAAINGKSGESLREDSEHTDCDNKEEGAAEAVHAESRTRFEAEAHIMHDSAIVVRFQFLHDLTEEITADKSAKKEKVTRTKLRNWGGVVSLEPGTPVVAGEAENSTTATFLILRAGIAD